MKDREDLITHHRNYCIHYKPQGAKTVCAAGCDIKRIQCVKTGTSSIKWGPCIEGHLLPDVLALCPKWERPSREDGERWADMVDADMDRMRKVGPVVAEWRKKPPLGKQEVITCPACGGRLHLSQAAYNGHVWGRCETPNCVAWME